MYLPSIIKHTAALMAWEEKTNQGLQNGIKKKFDDPVQRLSLNFDLNHLIKIFFSQLERSGYGLESKEH